MEFIDLIIESGKSLERKNTVRHIIISEQRREYNLKNYTPNITSIAIIFTEGTQHTSKKRWFKNNQWSYLFFYEESFRKAEQVV